MRVVGVKVFTAHALPTFQVIVLFAKFAVDVCTVPAVVHTSSSVLEIVHTIWSRLEPLEEAGSKVPL